MTHPSPTALEEISGALDALRTGQRQLDQDGVFVGVSRQALDEVLTHIAALAVALDKSQTIPDHEHLTWDNCPHEHIGCQDCGAPVSGAATTAPTAALTEEEHSQVEDARRTRQRELKYHAEKYPSEWWSEAILELTDIIDRIATKPAKSTPQGAEE